MTALPAVPADGWVTSGVETRGAQAAPASSGPSARLAHQPALDGLRGLAVGAVWLYHLERLEGGFLGVDLFFVLSGFLITSVLLVEHRARGGIDLVRFWGRRARRLLPALLVLLTGTSLLLVLLTPQEQRHPFRGDALATLGYVANWHEMEVDAGFVLRVFPHTWSLAIEEQFYVLWPLATVLVLGAAHRLTRGGRRRPAVGAWADGRRRLLGWWALGGAAVSFALMAWLYSSTNLARLNHAYYGTDTRLGPILLGAALAVFAGVRRSLPGSGLSSGPAGNGGELPTARVLHVRRSGAAVWGRELAGWVALAWMGWSVVTVAVLYPWYYRGGLLLFAGAAVVVVWAVTDGTGPLARFLALAPLRWLGLVSYGVYLWHWPIRTYITFDRVHVDRWALDALRVVCTLAVAALSYVLVEQPIRRGALQGRPLYVAAAGGVAVTVVAVLAASATAA